MPLSEVLLETEHRPWPLPSGQWAMTQWWRDLLFAHWPVDPAQIAPLLPSTVELDLFDGMAWVAVVPFQMTGVRPCYSPTLPWLSDFEELNLRTYVRPRRGPVDQPGVHFWSLDASQPVAVEFARRVFHLAYQHARMRLTKRDGWVEYESHRPQADFRARYRPREAARRTPLLTWLTERYCLYTTSPAGVLYQGQIHHRQWPLFEAEAEIETNTIAAASGVVLPDTPPLLHFAEAIEVAIWPLKRVG